ncbi:transcriptional regulator, TetR family [Fontimonas thermophila]|uniref:Transcriptional regulator, TetR family n=1 Tax=Fontimonas thermophila TaxID=1076937 RepID=A0A1I2I9G1_9GAMM|nr:HTH-type transcriptional repressor FabR [Fontimonas thermophila]SFF38932.1 transcriptional regulator, TetR family [Fontimonas thermophila]
MFTMIRKTRSHRRRGEETQIPGDGRDARKQRTRRALLDAALQLLEGERSFSSLSLREVTKTAGITPAAFYRHFSGMEDLGHALIEDSFASLHQLMRQAREGGLPATHIIRASVTTFLDYAGAHRAHFRFIAKERFSGSSALRMAIRKEIRLWIGELAVDLSRFPALGRFSADDLQVLAGLMVHVIIAATELLLDTPPTDRAALKRIYRDAEKQMRLVILGAAQWDSSRSKSG